MTGLPLTHLPLTPFLASVAQEALPLFGKESFLSFLTNSCFVAAIVLGLVFWFSRKATTNMQLVPHPAQNLFELIVEFLYARVSEIVGPKVAPKVFPLLATLFVFILVSNWFGLLPGVGTIGFGEGSYISISHMETPLLRPATADMNMTLGMALMFMVVWFVITLREVGLVAFLKHLFCPKGRFTGFMAYLMMVIFAVVGIIEVVSICIRPVSLSLRLFGNVFAGETLLHTMMNLMQVLGLHPIFQWLGRLVLPIPFYFMELLVGLVQAVVFTLLCSVYVLLSTHEEHEDHAEGEHDH
ncbi:MAG: F0F1 ATP synthase subunit A [Roseimicrobium sp.]